MSRNEKGQWVGVLMILLSVLLMIFTLCSFFFGIFVKPDIAIRALEKQGYENVQILEKEWLFVYFRGCSGSDNAMFKAKATNPAKRETDVIVCVGWPFKSATIRTD
ncbi:MAG TPA: hypothetical protein PLK35_01630 [Candidatus Moranbacteria bacterium]|nr:hypothetical protein [Candidatus Moranbacteria bacterium]